MRVMDVHLKIRLIFITLMMFMNPLLLVRPAAATFAGENGQIYSARQESHSYTNSENQVVTKFSTTIYSTTDVSNVGTGSSVISPVQQGDKLYSALSQPAISKDGTRLIVIKEVIDLLNQAESSTELWISNSDGSNAHQVLELDSSYATTNSWSPDNHTVLVGTLDAANNDYNLYTVDVDAANPSLNPFLTGLSTNPLEGYFSPDGNKIIYTNIDPNTFNTDTFILDISNGLGEQTNFGVVLSKANPSANALTPRWEPDGTLVISEQDPNSPNDFNLYRYTVDNSQIPTFIANGFSAVPSPDGNLLFYHKISSETGVIETYISDRNGSNESLVYATANANETFVVSDWQSLPPVILESLTVSPSPALLNRGVQQQLTVTGHYSDSSTQNVTTQATYSSSNPAIAAINVSGLVTSVSVGQATITVNFENKQVTVPITVNPTTPGTPTNVNLVNGGSPGVLSLSWGAPADNGGAAISNYVIFRRTGTNGSFNQLASVNGSTFSYSDSGLTTGVIYYYYIVAVNSVGQGPQSSTVSRQAPGLFGNPICVLFICI